MLNATVNVTPAAAAASADQPANRGNDRVILLPPSSPSLPPYSPHSPARTNAGAELLRSWLNGPAGNILYVLQEQ
jgi:hypothetical protein